MRRPVWYLSIPQPARWTAAGAIVLGGAGTIFGIVEAMVLYPLISWFGVTAYVGVLGAVAGSLLGVAGGLGLVLAERLRGRRRVG